MRFLEFDNDEPRFIETSFIFADFYSKLYNESLRYLSNIHVY